MKLELVAQLATINVKGAIQNKDMIRKRFIAGQPNYSFDSS
jgi:hypothetical protein